MPLQRENVLLVEGESDKAFFEALIKQLELSAAVQVAPPRDVGGTHNNKQGLLNFLPVLLNQLDQGSLKRLAIVVDADQTAVSKQGYESTFTRLADRLHAKGFSRAKQASGHGILFNNPNFDELLGVWIMPNNRDEGTLEDFLSGCVVEGERSLYQHAQGAVRGLAEPKFAAPQRVKAEMATWLAWQKRPGRGPEEALREQLFDAQCPALTGLTDWLRRVYP